MAYYKRTTSGKNNNFDPLKDTYNDSLSSLTKVNNSNSYSFTNTTKTTKTSSQKSSSKNNNSSVTDDGRFVVDTSASIKANTVTNEYPTSGIKKYNYTYEPHQRTTGGGGVNSISGSYLDDNRTWRTVDDSYLSNVINNNSLEVSDKVTNNINDYVNSADQSYYDTVVNEQAQTQIQEVERRTIDQFSLAGNKSARYRQLASKLSDLASSNKSEAGNWDFGFNVANGVLAGAGVLIGALFGGGAGATLGGTIAGAVNSVINLFNPSSKYEERSETYKNMQTNVVNYLTNLTNRDTTIMKTMDSIYSSMDNMRATYGDSFVDLVYNYYLAQSGMTSDAYSMLTGNFNNFELGNGKYGQMSAEGDFFDTLTDANQQRFNNVYAQLRLGDITGNKNLMDSMMQALYGSNTELGISLRGYENELRTALTQSLGQQSQYLYGARSDLASIGTNARSENISATESIGSAEADQATSGLRGGTTANNANLARLQRDLGVIQRTAQTASVIGTLKYNIQNAQLNASATAYSYRQAQRKAVTGTLNGIVSNMNSVVRTGSMGLP